MKTAVLKFILFYPLSLFAALFTWAFGWLIAMPYRMEYREDTVKYFNKQVKGFSREYLLGCFKWFGTHDNAADEWFWGCYWRDTWWAGWLDTSHYYNKYYGWLIHYLCRVFWLYRNPAYGFAYAKLGFERETGYTEKINFYRDDNSLTWYETTVTTNPNGKKAFKVKGYFYLTKTFYFDVNIGWKAHDSFNRLMFAGRAVPRW